MPAPIHLRSTISSGPLVFPVCEPLRPDHCHGADGHDLPGAKNARPAVPAPPVCRAFRPVRLDTHGPHLVSVSQPNGRAGRMGQHQGVRPDFCRQGQSRPRGTATVPAGVGAGEPTAAYSEGPGRIQCHPGPRTGRLGLPGAEQCGLHVSGAAPAPLGSGVPNTRTGTPQITLRSTRASGPVLRLRPLFLSPAPPTGILPKSIPLGAVPVSPSLRDYERPFRRPRQSLRSPRFTTGVPRGYRAPETDSRESSFTCESHRVGSRGPDGRVAGLGSGAAAEPRSGEHRSRRYRWRGHRCHGP